MLAFNEHGNGFLLVISRCSSTSRNINCQSFSKPSWARPLEAGELSKRLEILASRSYQYPTKDTPVTFGVSTIERWYYNALKSNAPIEALEHKPRSDIGENKAMSAALLSDLGRQYRNFSNWSYKLHADNLVALIEERPELGNAPSYSTAQRRMKEHEGA